jgi:hypothetical protein
VALNWVVCKGAVPIPGQWRGTYGQVDRLMDRRMSIPGRGGGHGPIGHLRTDGRTDG